MRLNRQIEEGVYNIKPEDYDENGELKEIFEVVEDFDIKSSADFMKNKEELKNDE